MLRASISVLHLHSSPLTSTFSSVWAFLANFILVDAAVCSNSRITIELAEGVSGSQDTSSAVLERCDGLLSCFQLFDAETFRGEAIADEMHVEAVRGPVLGCKLVVVSYNLMGDGKSRTHTSSVRIRYSKQLN